MIILNSFGYFVAGSVAALMGGLGLITLICIRTYLDVEKEVEETLRGLTPEQREELQTTARTIYDGSNPGMLVISGVDHSTLKRIEEIVNEELNSDSGGSHVRCSDNRS